MRILLTGGSGMVGRNLLDHASAREYEILAPRSRELNLLDREAVAEYLRENKPDLLIHAAGRVGGIQANMADPVGFLVENTQMGVHVINEAYRAGISHCINLSSSCVYPRNAPNPLSEDQILTGELEPTNEGYALAKITAMRLCQYISQISGSAHYTTLIPCNLYGRHDKFDPANSHMIPAVIRKIHEARQSNASSVEIWGDGEAQREFMYVEDLADCVFSVAEKMRIGDEVPDVMNVGIGRDYSVNEYYQAVASVIGFEGEFVHNLSKPVGMRQKLIDSTKINQLGWMPSTELSVGIEKTYRFFLEEVTNG
ncbi:GDP-L-fucose synthase [Halomonas sp. I5-271120]|uniref:GDP-L-fucose synthase family protein n=1 Tax=Halomonas sp. I5-271120 TaxID=3061632 RepID=UPI0027145AA2|nr:GDP-L-fucose synthase [Halomonas sp. I5-271120]